MSNKKYLVIAPRKCSPLTKTILLLALFIGYGKVVYSYETNSTSEYSDNIKVDNQTILVQESINLKEHLVSQDNMPESSHLSSTELNSIIDSAIELTEPQHCFECMEIPDNLIQDYYHCEYYIARYNSYPLSEEDISRIKEKCPYRFCNLDARAYFSNVLNLLEERFKK